MQNISSIIRSLILVACAGIVACTERMDIDVDDAPAQLVIYGALSTDTAQHAISVRRSSNYFSNTAPEGISGAVVTLSDGDEVFPLTESLSEKGVYLTAPGVSGTEGKTYTLNVTVEFNGSTDEYEATSFLPYSVGVDSVVLQQSGLSSNLTDVLLYGRLPDSGATYLNIVAFKNGNTPLNDQLSDYSIIVNESAAVREIDGTVCMHIRSGYDEDRAFIERGDLVTVHVRSITKEYADYVQDVQSELRGSVPIFSGPPANIRTNIHTRNASNTTPVCGFFTAYSIQSGERVWR
ncbi:MAG: DUF4249 domain-containing protein [Tannerellaceae bacterium]|jgi:hypothetical protein|nr:DUF4249 domain-containing protein [Tannerellaceae bacterium]